MLTRSFQLDINTPNFRLWPWVHQGTEAKGVNIRDYVVKMVKGPRDNIGVLRKEDIDQKALEPAQQVC